MLQILVRVSQSHLAKEGKGAHVGVASEGVLHGTWGDKGGCGDI